PARLDSSKRTPSVATGYMASGLVPYLYECCRVALGVEGLTGRIWALSEYAFNPHATPPKLPAFWERVVMNWRKHTMKGGVEGRKLPGSGFKTHGNNITVAKVRRHMERELKRRRQGKQG